MAHRLCDDAAHVVLEAFFHDELQDYKTIDPVNIYLSDDGVVHAIGCGNILMVINAQI